MANGLGGDLPDDRSPLLKHPVALAAGAAPFMGLIGQKSIKHDPILGAEGARYKSMEELSRAARTGDVLVTTKPRGSFWKSTIAPFTGSEFYHAQPVTGRRGSKGLTADTAGLFEGSTRYMQGQTEDIARGMYDNYSDVVLMRPKKPLTPAQMEKFKADALWRSSQEYDKGKAVSSWFKDVFMPKIKGITDRGPQTVCEGNICSTVPSQAMHHATGKQVVPGKRPQDVFPTDFLRSDNYELVGSRIPNMGKYKKIPAWARRITPHASRGALGGYMAATTYGMQEDPAVLGAGLGGAAATLSGTALAHKMLGAEKARAALPGVREVAERIMVTGTDPNTFKHFATRRIPLTALGAAGGYYGLKKLLDSRKQQKAKDE